MEAGGKQDTVVEIGKRNVANKRLLINISGQLFATTSETLSKYPDTKLGHLTGNEPSTTNFFFESDAEIFKEILKFYRNGEVHCPKNVCFNDFKNHLEWWGIGTRFISDCCSTEMKEELNLEKDFNYFERRIKIDNPGGCTKLSYSVWSFLTDPCGKHTRCKLGAKIWAVFYLIVTLISGGCVMALTLPSVMRPTANVEFTNETGNDSIPMDVLYFGNGTCNDYLMSRSRTLIRSLKGLHMLLAVFYAVEIWTRFIFCPDKKYFWKSINGLDMGISLFECAVSLYISLVMDAFLVSNYIHLENPDAVCKQGVIIERAMFFVSQMRFLRLLSYASVYRYVV